MIKKGIALILIITIILMPMTVQAKDVIRYTTPAKVSLKTKIHNGKTACRVECNTKLKVIKETKAWAKVIYKGETLYVKKKWLHPKRSPKSTNLRS